MMNQIIDLLSSPWIHDLSPFLWKFPEAWGNWGPGGLRWYGLSYLAGFIVAYYLLLFAHEKSRSPYGKEDVLNLMTFQILGVLIGGRIGFVMLYRTEEFISDPLIIFYVWQGGMASHGGFIGVILATLWYTKKSYQSFWPVADLIASVVAPGLFFGRLANFVNGELWGKTTNVPWAVLFPKAPDFAMGIGRHPSQIYAAFLEGLLVFVFIQFRFWKTNLWEKKPGRLGGEFLISYSLARIFGEFFREPDASLILGISRGQFYSLILLIGGGWVIYLAEKRSTDSSKFSSK